MSKRSVKDNSCRPFIQIDNELISVLSNAEFKTYAQIKRRAGQDGECWESLEHMAKETGNSVNTLKRSLKSLKSKGLVLKTKRVGGTDLYELTPPDQWQLQGQNELPNIGQNELGDRPKRAGGVGQNELPNIGQNELLNISLTEIDPIELEPLTQDAREKSQERGGRVEQHQAAFEEARPEPKLEILPPINPTGLNRPILHPPTPTVPPSPSSPNVLPFERNFNNPNSRSWFEWQTGPGSNDYLPEFVDYLAGKWNRDKADVKRFFQKNRLNPEAIAVYFDDFKSSQTNVDDLVMNVLRKKFEEQNGRAANW
jgi:predicted transcriptional regulator